MVLCRPHHHSLGTAGDRDGAEERDTVTVSPNWTTYGKAPLLHQVDLLFMQKDHR